MRLLLAAATAAVLAAGLTACMGGDENGGDGGDNGGQPRITAPPGRIALQFDLKGNEAGAYLEATNLDGTDRVTLTIPPELSEPRVDSDVAWSPNGRELVFVRRLRNDQSLAIVDATGTGIRQIVPAGRLGALATPTWSPDAKRIAFVGEGPCTRRPADRPSLYVVNPNGRGLRRLPLLARGDTAFDGMAVDVTSLRWSPDGRTLLYVVLGYAPGDCIEGLEERTALYTLDVARARPTKLESSGIIISARWSPDGKQIAFSQACERLCKVVVVDRNGKGRRILTNPTGPGSPDEIDFVSVAWAPNGKEVIVAHGDEIAAVSVGTRKIRRIATIGGDFPEIEAVSKRGHIAVSSFDFETTEGTLYIVNSQTGGAREIPFPRPRNRQADVGDDVAVYLPGGFR